MWDREETKRRGYKGRSKVYFDGRERLYGEDWVRRKKELWDLQCGMCAHISCLSRIDDAHHVIWRSTSRDDRITNLLGLCRKHHDMAHEQRNPRLRRIA